MLDPLASTVSALCRHTARGCHHAAQTLGRAGLNGSYKFWVGLTLHTLLRALLLEAHIEAAAQLLDSRAAISALLHTLTRRLRPTKTATREVTHTATHTLTLACGTLGELLLAVEVARVNLLQEAAG